jgi:hypothetical protein
MLEMAREPAKRKEHGAGAEFDPVGAAGGSP